LRGKVQGDNLSIEYKDGVAVLSGTVIDAKIRKQAEALAEKVPGVNKVDNRLTVAERKRSISERLRGEGSHKGVVQAAHASDAGNHKRVQQINAEFADERLAGADGMPAQGMPMRTPNQEMAEQIGLVLKGAQLDNYDIQISFQNGVATLDGSVATQAERAMAHREVKSVPGVQSVNNRLRCFTDVSAAATQGQQGYGPRGDVRGAGYNMQPPAAPAPGMGYQAGPPMGGGMPMGPGAPPYPPAYGNQGMGANQAVYNSPNMPDYAWPTYAQYPNSAAVTYPTQYSASAWPYIGPFYPYPQVPLGWRDATLRWDDGQWNLMFRPRTDRWWWFLNPNNW
jgi:hypothetical protein